MSFSGLPFLLGFLPLALVGYAIAGRWGECGAKAWLIAMSVLFYAVGAKAFVPLLLLSVGINFLLLRQMYGSPNAGGWAAAGVTMNLMVLFWFKYFSPNLSPPLGLSFFTFSQIGSLLYHAAGDTKPPRARDYVLFAAFFPALLAGPILNPRETLPQFSRTSGWRLKSDDLAVGFGFFLIGLLKKTLLANHLTGLVTTGFTDPTQLAMFPAWEVAAAYSLQLYFDFSGYSDMAIGLAWMFGLRFPDNFDRPYRATSIILYWQSWHMSLTRFLMVHVHGPLTLAALRWRRGKGLAIDQTAQRGLSGFLTMIGMPVVVTMALVSLWHGTALTFLAFGALHAAFLLINHACRLYRTPPIPKIACIALTYVCVLIASVFFRAPDMAIAAAMLGGMLGMHDGASGLQPDVHIVLDVVWILGLYGIVWAAPSTRQLMQNDKTSLLHWRPTPQWAIVMGCAATIGLLATGGSTEFVYFRF